VQGRFDPAIGKSVPDQCVKPQYRDVRSAANKFTLLSTCFPTHHLAFTRDHDMLFFSAGVAGPGVLGWLDVKKFEQTGDEVQSQGWTPFVLDTSGDGKRGEYVEPDKPVEPGKDKRIAVNEYAVAVSPADGSVWGTVIGYPGRSCGPPSAQRRSRRRFPRFMSHRCLVMAHVAATSMPMAFTGLHSRAGTWAVSIGANAMC